MKKKIFRYQMRNIQVEITWDQNEHILGNDHC